jgi:hypothetical protein
MNLLYIRAAIQQATGVILEQEDILRLLVEEGLLTQTQANDDNLIFRGYDDFFSTDHALKKVESITEYIEDLSDGRREKNT